MPWSDNSDPGGKPGQKPGPRHGPWGAAPPAAGREEPPANDRHRSGRPRRQAPPPPPEDLIVIWRRVRRWAEHEFQVLGPHFNRRLIPLAVGAALAIWGLSGFYDVQAGQQGVVTTFGAYSRTTSPGWGYHLPTPIEAVDQVPVSALKETAIGSKAGDLPNEGLMLTADQNIVDLDMSLAWRVNDPRKFLFDIKDPEETIRAAGVSAMRLIVAGANLSDLTGSAKARIELEAAQATQKVLDRYGAGVTGVSMQIAAVTPPPAVAMDAHTVFAAQQDAQAAVDQANADADKMLADAKSQAAQQITAANGYKAKVITEAQGQADAFNNVDQQYRQAPAVIREQLYLQTMEQVLSRSSKVVVDAGGAPVVLPSDIFHSHSQDASARRRPPRPRLQARRNEPPGRHCGRGRQLYRGGAGGELAVRRRPEHPGCGA